MVIIDEWDALRLNKRDAHSDNEKTIKPKRKALELFNASVEEMVLVG